jgi:hypothetical protein
LFEKFGKAFGSKARPHVVKRLTRELKPLLAQGCDLEVDVLPELVEVGRKLRNSLSPGLFSAIAAQCRDRRDGRLAAQKAHRERAARPAQVAVARDSPAGEAWERWRRAAEGRGWPWSARGGGFWFFDSEWPPGMAAAEARA